MGCSLIGVDWLDRHTAGPINLRLVQSPTPTTFITRVGIEGVSTQAIFKRWSGSSMEPILWLALEVRRMAMEGKLTAPRATNTPVPICIRTKAVASVVSVELPVLVR